MNSALVLERENGRTTLQRIKFRPRAVILAFLALAVGLPLLTPTLNGLKPAGLPLGYAVVAQGIPALFAVLVAAVAWVRAYDR